MNSCNFVGRLTAEPELRRTGEGPAVCSFSLAIKRPMAKDTTDFIDFVAWRQSAEYLAQYGHKGDIVAVSGALQPRSWSDKDGNKRKAVEVVATSVTLLSSKKNTEGNAQPSQSQNGFLGGYSGPQQGYQPQQSYQPQKSYQQPQYNQQGFGGYQQPGFGGYHAPQQNDDFPQLTGDDAQLPF